MGKRNNSQPNAPDLQQVLLNPQASQPPHNPYYPDLSGAQLPPPPPYPAANRDHSTSSRMQSAYSTHHGDYQLPRQATVVIQQAPASSYDYSHAKRVRRFNSEVLVGGLLMIICSTVAYNLFIKRRCIDFVILKPAEDTVITVYTVRDGQLTTAFLGAVIFAVAILRCCQGATKTYSCYLTLVAILTFIATIITGYLSYLAYYSPCPASFEHIATNLVKTFVSKLATSVPSPERGIFGEANVFTYVKEDPSGVTIFALNLFMCLINASIFLSSLGKM